MKKIAILVAITTIIALLCSCSSYTDTDTSITSVITTTTETITEETAITTTITTQETTAITEENSIIIESSTAIASVIDELSLNANNNDLLVLAVNDSDIITLANELPTITIGEGDYILATALDDVVVTISKGEENLKLEWTATETISYAELYKGASVLICLPKDSDEYMLTVEKNSSSVQMLLNLNDGRYYLSLVDDTSIKEEEETTENTYALNIATAIALTEHLTKNTLDSATYPCDVAGFYAALKGIAGEESTLTEKEISSIFAVLGFTATSISNLYGSFDITQDNETIDFSSYTDVLFAVMDEDFSFMPAFGDKSVYVYADVFKGGFTFERNIYVVYFKNDPSDMTKTLLVDTITTMESNLAVSSVESVYKNNLYGYKLGLTNGFTLISSEDKTTTFENSTYNTTITLLYEEFDSYNAIAKLLSDFIEENDIEPIVTEVDTDCYTVIYKSGTNICYRKTLLNSDGNSVSVTYTYPSYGGEIYGSIIRGTRDSLEWIEE